jgi:hypothetical protein
MGWGIPKRGFRGNKFGARKVKHDNHTFDSRLEFAVYSILKLREKAGVSLHTEHLRTSPRNLNENVFPYNL